MIGAILVGDDYKFIYHKIAGKAIAEHTVSAFTAAQQVQRVVVVLPQTERKNISNNTQAALLSKDKMGVATKKIDFVYYAEDVDTISFTHQIAVDYGFDHIVLGNLNTGLIPSWLINEVIYSYFLQGKTITTYKPDDLETFDRMFRISILPFWKLARLASHASFRSLADIEYEVLFANSGEFSIPKSKNDLTLSNIDDIINIEYIYTEVSHGIDIGDLIKELNDQQT